MISRGLSLRIEHITKMKKKKSEAVGAGKAKVRSGLQIIKDARWKRKSPEDKPRNPP